FEKDELCRRYFYPWYGFDYPWPAYWAPFYAEGYSHHHGHPCSHRHAPTWSAFGPCYRGAFGIRQPSIAGIANGMYKSGASLDGLTGHHRGGTRDGAPKSEPPSKAGGERTRQSADSGGGSSPGRTH